jgi:hypothetical protein
MSSQAFHRTPGGRVQEITAGVRFEPRILQSFDPVTQELYWGLTYNHSTHSRELKTKINTGGLYCQEQSRARRNIERGGREVIQYL